jgi:hypothetical protein|tara:strand:+ start:1624 stop:1884 length:261 start_codon:yes stop_codon:yes gene_type:complete
MNIKTATDEAILFDLEYRGIQDFLSTLNDGLEVPRCFVEDVKRIIELNYEITLKEIDTNGIDSGCFCLMDYQNQERVILQGIYTES